MKHICTLLLLLLASIPGVFANNAVANDSLTTVALQEINKIKLDTEHYLYAEATMTDWLEAYESAKLLLKEKLTEWITTQNGSDVSGCVAKSDEKIFELKAKRGDKYRAFVYLKKSDIIAFSENRQVLTVNVSKKDNNKAEAINNSQNSKQSVLQQDHQVLQQEQMVQKQEQQTLQQEPQAQTSQKQDKEELQYVLSIMEKGMLMVKASSEIKNFIKEKKEKGVIADYGKYTDRPTTGEYYLFVYDHDGQLPAYLKNENGKLINLNTRSVDSFDNYKGCGAIWFTIK